MNNDFDCIGPVLFVSPAAEYSPSLATIFNETSDGVFQSRLVNMTYNCASKKLVIHVAVNSQIEVIKQVLNFERFTFSLSMFVDSRNTFETAIFSGSTTFLDIPAFVAVRFKYTTRAVYIRGIPTEQRITTKIALEAISGKELKIPTAISVLSDLKLMGKIEKGMTTFTMEGKSNGHAVVLLHVLSTNNSDTALIASISSMNLKQLIATTLDIDISKTPVYADLRVSNVRFSSATGEITTPLLSQIFPPNSPLAVFGSRVHSGIRAYLTAQIAGVSMTGTLSDKQLTFAVPSGVQLPLSKLISQYPGLSGLGSFPIVKRSITGSTVSRFSYNPESKSLVLSAYLSKLLVIPKVMRLSKVALEIDATLQPTLSVAQLNITSSWLFGSLNVTTRLSYNSTEGIYRVKGIDPKTSQTLQINSLFKNILSSNLPRALKSFTLITVVGNIYSNGNYIIVFSGSLTKGSVCLVFLKDSTGTKLGLVASVERMRLSDVVHSSNGMDISGTPYFGHLNISMEISIASSPIEKSRLINILPNKDFPTDSNTFPSGVSSHFKIQVSGTTGIDCTFNNGVVKCLPPNSGDFTVKHLARDIPGLGEAINDLPSQISDMLKAKVNFFFYNTTTKDLTIDVELNEFILVKDFLSLSDVRIRYEGTLGAVVSTTSIEIEGTWHILDFLLDTSIEYDVLHKEYSISSSANVDASTSDLVLRFTGKSLSLPSSISSFNLTGVTGKYVYDKIALALHGVINRGKIVCLFHKSSNESGGAVVVDILGFKLDELVQLASGIDISDSQYFGSLEIPRLRFAVATNVIRGQVLQGLAHSGSPLDMFRGGISKGVSGRSLLKMGQAGLVALNYANNLLMFRPSNASSLSLSALFSAMPGIRDIFSHLPSRLIDVLQTEVQGFSFDPVSTELVFNGSLTDPVDLVNNLISLTQVRVSIVATLGRKKKMEKVILRGNGILGKIPFQIAVSYDGRHKTLQLTGELKKQVELNDLLSLLSSNTLSIPPVLTSVSLTKLSGTVSDEATLVFLSGTISEGEIHFAYRKSKSGDAVGIAAAKESFRFSSLVSTALGVDISNIPYFGTLVITDIGLTISSAYITSPLLPTLYPPSSVLANFGESLDQGLKAAFALTLGDVRGVTANFVEDKLELEVPDNSQLYFSKLLQLLPNLKQAITALPQAFQSLLSALVKNLEYRPKANEIELEGRVKSVVIIPDFMVLRNCNYSILGTIGGNSILKYASFYGLWALDSLSLNIEVIYDEGFFMIDAYPEVRRSLNLQNLLSKFTTNRPFSLPPAFNALEINNVIGRIGKGIESLVFTGKVGKAANVSIVYEKSQNSRVVVFAADVKQFRLSDIILGGTRVDISKVPFFGSLVVPSTSFVISSDNFSTLNLPDINKTPGIPTQLSLETISKGLNGQFRVKIGKAANLIGEYAGNLLTIKPPSSVTLSLLDLLSVIPEMRAATDSLPQFLQVLKSTNITSVAYKPGSKKLLISLNIASLTIIPNILNLEQVKVVFDIDISGPRVSSEQTNQHLDYFDQDVVHYDQENAVVQVILYELRIEGKWNLLDNYVAMFVRYDGKRGKFNIQGRPPINTKSLSINNLISKFSNMKLKLPQISQIKLDNIRAVSSSSDIATTLIITATAGASNRIHFFYRGTEEGHGIAVAAELQMSLVQLVKTVANTDLSSVPFIDSYGEISMGFISSSTAIQTPLLRNLFDSDSPLKAYVRGIPEGTTAHMNVVVGGCLEVELMYVNKELMFSVPYKCKLTLTNLISEIPVMKTIVNALPPPISDLLASDVKSILFDPPTKLLSLKAQFHELNFFNLLVIRNLKLSLTANLGKNSLVRSLTFNGDLILCDKTVKTSVSFNKDNQQLFFEASPNPGLSITSITGCLFNKNFKLLSFLNGAKITNILGQKIEDTFTFVMKGSIGSKFQVFLVYKRTVGESAQYAVAASVESFKLANLLKEAVGIDIRGIPFFGSIRVPRLGFSIVPRGAIATPLLNRLVPGSSPLKRYASYLPSGFTAIIDLPVGGRRLTGTYINKVLSFTAFGGGVSLGSLLKEIPGIDVIATGITAVFKDIMNLKVKRLVFDIQQNEMEITVHLSKFSVFGDGLSLRDVDIMINATFSEKRKLSVRASGVLTLGNKDYAVSIHRSRSTPNYVLSVHTKELSVIGLLKAVGGSFLPKGLQVLVGKIFDISVLNATLQYPFGEMPKHMLFSGMPQLFGLKTVHVSALLIEQGGENKLIQKYTLPGFSISDLLSKIFGKSIPSKLLQRKSVTSIIVSPLTLENMRLSVPDFRDIAISEGVSVSTVFSWPSSCGGDAFCRVMKILLGAQSKLMLHGTFQNARYYSLIVAVSDVRLGRSVVLKRAGLEFVGGVEQTVGLVGSIELNSPPVTLNAAIKLTPSGVKLEGSMTGCWERAFGVPVLVVCNLFMSMSIAPIPIPISGLEFGGRIEIGNRRCGLNKLLTAEAYIGINSIDPRQNYFYADIGQLTFQRFFDAFCIRVTLPKPLGESGFPKGLKTSFSLIGKQLPHAGITIPIGFRFKGTYNILGLTSSADINIQPNRLKVSVELPRLNILGVLKMYKSRTEKSKGPFFYADISTTKLPTIEISGFVEVLGISVEGRLLITNTKFEVFVEGRIFGLFIASLRISTGYSKNVNSAPFEIEGRFKNDLFDRIAKGVRDGLQKSADEADKHISAAQNKIRGAKGKLDNAINSLERAKRKIDDAKRLFDVAIGKIESARRKLDGVCRIKKCNPG